MTRYEKILGGLAGAAIGDALGSATESRSTEQIIEKFGGIVTDFIAPPDDAYAHGFPKGSVTDDFSRAYYIAQAIIDNNGAVNERTADEALLKWSETRYFTIAGDTSKGAVRRIRGETTEKPRFVVATDNARGSNGAAMKVAPAGLVSGGDVDAAIKNAITVCKTTHNNSTSLSGACAVAAAVAEALNDDATIDSIIEKGLYGAQKGEEYGKKYGARLANPSVYKRIKLADKISQEYHGDMIGCMRELTDIIGSGLSAREAVPCAFGLFRCFDGDAMQCIIAGANIGSDTDTVATIAGAISGTFSGVESVDKNKLEIIESVNNFNLEKMAESLVKVSAE